MYVTITLVSNAVKCAGLFDNLKLLGFHEVKESPCSLFPVLPEPFSIASGCDERVWRNSASAISMKSTRLSTHPSSPATPQSAPYPAAHEHPSPGRGTASSFRASGAPSSAGPCARRIRPEASGWRRSSERLQIPLRRIELRPRRDRLAPVEHVPLPVPGRRGKHEPAIRPPRMLPQEVQSSLLKQSSDRCAL